MKLFKHSAGFIICIGFDMQERKENPRIICWSDPATGSWDTKPSNLAGWVCTPMEVRPEFVFEANGKVVAYQPGLCIEMACIGGPNVWGFSYVNKDAQEVV